MTAFPWLMLFALAGPASRVAETDAGAAFVRNGGFEADRFQAPPGLAWDNGGITAWEFTGRVGLNPVVSGENARTLRPILNNGRIPEGRTAAFLKPTATLRQVVRGLPNGHKFVLEYRETAALPPGGGPLPRLTVLFENRVIVPCHQVHPVDPIKTYRTPFRRIVSLPFQASRGNGRLIFLCSGPRRAAVGIDGVRILPADGHAPSPTPFRTAGPVLLNASFEADHYTRRPGYAANNGGMTAWSVKGHAGVNPCWGDRCRRWGARADFADNGRTPDGGQVAFIQNIGELRQHVTGWEPGKKYRIVYYENGRVTRAVPDDQVIEVLVGNRTIVSSHPVPPVDFRGRHQIGYFRVESAVFPAPSSGEADVVFRTHKDGGTTVLIDAIRIEEVR